MKPVRDIALQALQLWKNLPGPNTAEASEAGSSVKGILVDALSLNVVQIARSSELMPSKIFLLFMYCVNYPWCYFSSVGDKYFEMIHCVISTSGSFLSLCSHLGNHKHLCFM